MTFDFRVSRGRGAKKAPKIGRYRVKIIGLGRQVGR